VAIDLLFTSAPASSGALVFGDDGSASPARGDATVRLVTSFPGFSAAVAIRAGVRLGAVATLPLLSGTVPVLGSGKAKFNLVAELPALGGVVPVNTRTSPHVRVVGALPELAGHVAIQAWPGIAFVGSLPGLSGCVPVDAARVVRYMQAAASARFQKGTPAEGALVSSWGLSQDHRGGMGSAWQQGAASGRAADARHGLSLPQRLAAAPHWQQAGAWQVNSQARHQQASRRMQARQAAHGVAQALSCRTPTAMQDAQRLRRHLHALHRLALALQHERLGRSGASAHSRGWQFGEGRYQQAMHPHTGRSELPVVPPAQAGCYVPSGALVFAEAWSDRPPLVFICDGDDGLSPGPVVVPIRKVYVVVNNVSLKRVDGNIELPNSSFTLSLDADSWAWGFSASLPGSALVNLEPVSDGAPVELEAMVNGTAFRVLVESISRERTFGKSSIRVQGRGKTALLDAPYAPTRNFDSAAARTAQQLMAHILSVNGAPMDWSLSWSLTDWLVPAGVFAHQGSYISALNVIAAAAGGYIQPHASLQALDVLPRYPVVPWSWAAEVTPDFELPADVTTREAIEWVERARYNRVFVSGQQSGVLGQVTRAGTAGDVRAPMVTDALITAAAAARQRGISILGNTGRQANISLRLPVLPETGVITPGKFVRYVDAGVSRIGIVRSVSLDAGFPDVFQSIGVETHV